MAYVPDEYCYCHPSHGLRQTARTSRELLDLEGSENILRTEPEPKYILKLGDGLVIAVIVGRGVPP